MGKLGIGKKTIATAKKTLHTKYEIESEEEKKDSEQNDKEWFTTSTQRLKRQLFYDHRILSLALSLDLEYGDE